MTSSSPTDLSAITPLYGSSTDRSQRPARPNSWTAPARRLGLFELDSYLPRATSTLFVSQYSLPTIHPLSSGYRDHGRRRAGNRQAGCLRGQFRHTTGTTGRRERDEVTLDIDMMLALAPNASAVYSYEGNQELTAVTANTTVAVDIFHEDGRRHCCSTAAASRSSRSSAPVLGDQPEGDEDPAIRAAENTIFQQMAAQGQSVFSATGDLGAYDQFNAITILRDGSLGPISVDSPGLGQPFVTAVGGTTLNYSKPTTIARRPGVLPAAGSYVSEIGLEDRHSQQYHRRPGRRRRRHQCGLA